MNSKMQRYLLSARHYATVALRWSLDTCISAFSRAVGYPRVPVRWALLYLYRRTFGTDMRAYLDETFQDPEMRLQWLYTWLWANGVIVRATAIPFGPRARLISRQTLLTPARDRSSIHIGHDIDLFPISGTSDLAFAGHPRIARYLFATVSAARIWALSRELRLLSPSSSGGDWR